MQNMARGISRTFLSVYLLCVCGTCIRYQSPEDTALTDYAYIWNLVFLHYCHPTSSPQIPIKKVNLPDGGLEMCSFCSQFGMETGMR